MYIIPVYNMTILPGAITFLGREAFQKSTNSPAEAGDRVILLPTKTENEQGGLAEGDFRELAVSGVIGRPDVHGFVEVKTQDRVHVDGADVLPGGKIRLAVSQCPETRDLAPEAEREKYLALRQALLEFSAKQDWAPMAQYMLSFCDTLNGLITLLSPFMELPAEERYALLAENSVRERAERIEAAVYEWIELARLSGEGSEKREADYKKVYRENAIRKQLAYLQQQLDELHPENVSELRRLEQRLEAAGMNETAEKEARKVLQRLKSENESSQEYSMLFDYLDFLLSLPWSREPAREIPLAEARQTLDAEHYGLKKIKERIIQQIAVLNLRKAQSGSILCFVGAPGTGKTSIGKSIADALGRKYVRVSLGGVRDEADIRGHRRTYVGAMPGRIMDGIAKAGVSNPVVVLDEVDKLGVSYQGDPAAALLEVLDPEQNNSFTDHYLNVPFDLSDVLFLCTANTLDSIPAPLLNRMEVIPFTGYTETEKYHIAVRHLLPKAEQAAGLEPGRIRIDEQTMRALIADYTMEAGVRGLKKLLDTLCRSAAVRLVEGNAETMTVTKEDLRELLDRRPIHHALAPEAQRPGVVTGLAWTQAGGDVLYVETLFTKGSGKVTVTGQLGDVMKESVQIAVSLVKSLYPEKAELFERNDLHVHVPDGAVPKDGPSAGITLTTALSSLVTGQAVSPQLAMTGEVSLRGLVSPIGGLPEKLMAAKRAGVHKVLIPAENEQDLQDVADEIKQSLTIVPVSTVSEVLSETRLTQTQPV